MSKEASAAADERPVRIALYSDDRTVRNQVHLVLGGRIAADLGPCEITDFATPDAVITSMQDVDYDVAIFDGEAVPLGGLGLCHQVKDEIPFPPPVVVLVPRVADAWLAAWSLADGISSYPLDPIRLPETVAQVVRADRSGAETLSSGEPALEPGGSSRH